MAAGEALPVNFSGAICVDGPEIADARVLRATEFQNRAQDQPSDSNQLFRAKLGERVQHRHERRSRDASHETMWQVHDRRSKTDWPRVQINLAKKIRLRYIALTLLIRYVGIRVALTTVKRVLKFSALLILAGLTSAVAGTTFEVQPSPTPADENSHDILSYRRRTPSRAILRNLSLGMVIRFTMTSAMITGF